MMLLGLEFPRDHIPRPDQGPVARFLISIHPLAMWVPALALGVLVGWFLR